MIDFKNLNINCLDAATDFEQQVKNFVDEWMSDTKTVLVKTSGSTGTPKILEVEKQKMLNSAKMTCDFLELKEGDSALIVLPVEYISGKMMVVRAIERKLRLYISEPNLKPLESLGEEIDFCAMTPLQVEHSLDKIHLIKKLIIGGASVSEDLKKKIFGHLGSQFSTLGYEIYETYGMSETLSHIALKQIYPKSDDYFKVLNNVEISTDERGCLKIDAPKINSDVLQTNDLVELINEKEFRYLGRIDNVINSGGAKIFPEELEALVKKYIPNEVVFIGIPDESLGQKLVLVVESKQSESINRVLSTINYKKSFHKPKEIIFVEKIPRTPNGKVNRLELLSQILNT